MQPPYVGKLFHPFVYTFIPTPRHRTHAGSSPEHTNCDDGIVDDEHNGLCQIIIQYYIIT